MKKTLFFIVPLLLLSFGTASAFPLYSGDSLLGGTLFEDNNIDFFVDNNRDGLLNAGDDLVSAVEFENIVDLTGGAPAYNLNTAADELVAIASIRLVDDNFAHPVLGNVWSFGEIPGTPAISVYSGGPINLDLFTAGSDPSLAGAIAAVTDGTHLWDFSLAGDLDTYWYFTPLLPAAAQPGVVAGLPSDVKVGLLNYALVNTFNSPGTLFTDLVSVFTLGGDDGFVDLRGSGDILGGLGLVNGGFARSDIDAVVNVVPEPSTFILLGAGLLGLGIMRKRSRNK